MLRVGTATLAANTDPGLIDGHRGDAEQRRRADRQPPLHGHHRGPDSQATAATVKLLVGESTPSPETGAQTEGPACLFDMPGPF